MYTMIVNVSKKVDKSIVIKEKKRRGEEYNVNI